MNNHLTIAVGKDHFLKFETEDDEIKLHDVHYERITPSDPTKHFVSTPLYSVSKEDARELIEFLVASV